MTYEKTIQDKTKDFEKETRKLEREKTSLKDLDEHQKQVNGKHHGMFIQKNSSVGENKSNPNSPENKKKKDWDFYNRILKETLDYLKEQSAKIERAIKAGLKLRELYKKGELDYSNPEHITMMEEYGITREEIQASGESAFDKRDEELFNQKVEFDRKIQQGETLESYHLTNPNDPNIQNEIKNFAAHTPIFDKGDLTFRTLNEKTNKNYKEIEANFGSIASKESPEGILSNKSIKAEFTNVSSANQLATNDVKYENTFDVPKPT
ncbi:MAG: hypothetical protein AAGB24_06140 [Bacteroidota bacterium]